MGSETIQRDLSRKLQNTLAEAYERELRIAGVILGSGDMAQLMFEAAVMMLRTSAVSIASLATDPGELPSLYDLAIASIMEAERAGRAEALKRAVAREGRPI